MFADCVVFSRRVPCSADGEMPKCNKQLWHLRKIFREYCARCIREVLGCWGYRTLANVYCSCGNTGKVHLDLARGTFEMAGKGESQCCGISAPSAAFDNEVWLYPLRPCRELMKYLIRQSANRRGLAWSVFEFLGYLLAKQKFGCRFKDLEDVDLTWSAKWRGRGFGMEVGVLEAHSWIWWSYPIFLTRQGVEYQSSYCDCDRRKLTEGAPASRWKARSIQCAITTCDNVHTPTPAGSIKLYTASRTRAWTNCIEMREK